MRPNILFLLPDQHRHDWIGINSNLSLSTPNLNKLCNNGTTFLNAFTPSPLCAPSRACLATGQNYKNCNVLSNKNNLPISMPNYFRKLKESGYEVIGVGKLDIHKLDRNWGLDGSNLLNEYGFTDGIDNEGKGDAILSYINNNNQPNGPYMKYLMENNLIDMHLAMYEPYIDKPGWLNFTAVTDLPDEAYCDNWITNNAINFLNKLPLKKPWHIVVNFVGPHSPFDVTTTMRDKWKEIDFPQPINNTENDRNLTLIRQQNYAAMIENIDNNIGKIIKSVEDRGELDNTIIVYSSDHGEMLGDHNRWGKSVWYHPASAVPLIITGPNICKNRQTNSLVALNDLASTFLDYAESEKLHDIDGMSLKPILEDINSKIREYIISGLDDWTMIFDGKYKLILKNGSPPLLYDLVEDKFELNNIAGNNMEIVHSLNNLILTHRNK